MKRAAAILLGLVGLLVLLALLGEEGRRSREHTPLTLDLADSGRGGGRAFWLLAQAQGDARRVEPGGSVEGALVLLPHDPVQEPATAEWALEHARGGGQVLAVVDAEDPLTRALGVRVSPSLTLDREPVAVPAAVPGVRRAQVRTGAGGLTLPEGAEAVAREGDRVVLARVPQGRGAVWVLADPWPLSNEGLDAADNAWLALQLTAPGPRTFMVRTQERQTLEGRLLADPWVRRAAALAALLALLFWLNEGVRTSRALVPVTVRERSQLDYVDAVAGLYRQASQPQLPLESLYAWACVRLGRALGLRGRPTLSRLLPQLRLRRDLDAARLEKVFTEVEARLRDPRGDVLSLARELQRAVHEVEERLRGHEH